MSMSYPLVVGLGVDDAKTLIFSIKPGISSSQKMIRLDLAAAESASRTTSTRNLDLTPLRFSFSACPIDIAIVL